MSRLFFPFGVSWIPFEGYWNSTKLNWRFKCSRSNLWYPFFNFGGFFLSWKWLNLHNWLPWTALGCDRWFLIIPCHIYSFSGICLFLCLWLLLNYQIIKDIQILTAIILTLFRIASANSKKTFSMLMLDFALVSRNLIPCSLAMASPWVVGMILLSSMSHLLPSSIFSTSSFACYNTIWEPLRRGNNKPHRCSEATWLCFQSSWHLLHRKLAIFPSLHGSKMLL